MSSYIYILLSQHKVSALHDLRTLLSLLYRIKTIIQSAFNIKRTGDIYFLPYAMTPLINNAGPGVLVSPLLMFM